MAIQQDAIVDVAVDVGNATVKFSGQRAGTWAVESSRVAVAPPHPSFAVHERPIPWFVYVSGPAALDPNPYYVGDAVDLSGITGDTIVGRAERRVKSSAYLVLHLYGILRAVQRLPLEAVTEADGTVVYPVTVAFTGGVPQADSTNTPVLTLLRHRLTGRTSPSAPAEPHRIRYGPPGHENLYQITVADVVVFPQPLGGLAVHLLDTQGAFLTDTAMNRKFFLLDIGGGTTDRAVWEHMQPVQGADGSDDLGMHHVARYAMEHIVRRYPQMSGSDAGVVLDCLRRKETQLQIGRDWVDIEQEIRWAFRTVGEHIMRAVQQAWGPTLPSGEVVLFGGGGAAFYPYIAEQLRDVTAVTLVPHSVTAVVEGFRRMALFVRRTKMNGSHG